MRSHDFKDNSKVMAAFNGGNCDVMESPVRNAVTSQEENNI